MVDEDDVFLRTLNHKRDGANQCTEDEFEEVMSFFEETAQLKQPYAAVDNPPVPSFVELQECMDNDAVEDSVRRFAKDIYPHWKSRRIEAGNCPLLPSLKVSSSLARPSLCNFEDRSDDVTVLTSHSLKRARTRTTQIHMSVSVDVKSAKFARLAVEMPKAQTNCGGCGKSLKMLGSWLPSLGNVS